MSFSQKEFVKFVISLEIYKDMFTRPVFNAKDLSVIRIARLCLGGKIHVLVLLLISESRPGPDQVSVSVSNL